MQLIPVLVNGERKEAPLGQSVADLLDWLQLSSDRVAVEMNRCIVRKRDWSQTMVASGAEIEIVEFVGGG
ncbi:MAG: sulfur carrier protein ThiS [Acidobacteriaceae bacterium]|nr:sulfur carrier protein ThiS [Acidobacteriaceae bacterium]